MTASPELLAPAGGWPQLRAAVQAGADAVYLGVTELNARRQASNFGPGDLAEVVRYCHLRSTRVYLTLNVLVFDSELPRALEIADIAAEAGIDALIVQDLGLAALLSRRFRGWRLHASTQVGAHNSATVARLADLGFARVTLARELLVEEIARIAVSAGSVGCEIESFVHGALCYSYSGQCLLASFVGGRSANRGSCTQACRMPYDIVGRSDQALRQLGAFPLSMKDLCGLPALDRLASTGAAALKIEGRMKSPEYVAAAVSVYRRALDDLAAGVWSSAEARRKEDLDWLADAFNRGFTLGSLAGERGEALMSYGRPNNRGVAVARLLADAAGDELIARLDREVEVGDRLEVWTGGGSKGRQGGTVCSVEPVPGGGSRERRLRFDPDPRGVPLAGRAGDRVMRLTRAALVKRGDELSRRGANERRVGVALAVRAWVGEPIAVRARTPDGLEVSVQGPVLEPARTVPLTDDALEEHLGRLGNTVYRADSFQIDLGPDAGIGFGELHKLKDRLAALLDVARLDGARPVVRRSADAGGEAVSPTDTVRGVRLHAVTSTVEQALAALSAGADLVSVSAAALAVLGDELPDGDSRHPADGRLSLWVPAILHDDEVDDLFPCLEEWAERPTLVANLGMLSGASRDQTTDWRLGVTNGETARRMASLGATTVGLSPELTLDQVREVTFALRATGAAAEILVQGWVEVMTAESCPARILGACAERCDECPRASGWALRDAKGFRFPFETDARHRAHIFNAHELSLAHAVPDVLAAGVSSFRLDLTLAEGPDVTDVVATYRRLLSLAVTQPESARRDGRAWRTRREQKIALTTGHAFREVP